MKVTRTDAHDRLLQLQSQGDHISQGCMDCIANAPEEFTMPYYIFAHPRTIDIDERKAMYSQDVRECLMNPSLPRRFKSVEDTPSTRFIWMPRLTKPKAQTNSMLFKYYPGTDNIKVIWMIPDRSMWPAYQKGKMTESSMIGQSIFDFENNRSHLEDREPDDLCEEDVNRIYAMVSKNSYYKKFKPIS